MSFWGDMSGIWSRGLALVDGNAALSPIRDVHRLDPSLSNAVALHEEMPLPRPVKASVDLFVRRRDLAPGRTRSPIRSHVERLQNSAIFFTPGWGNHKPAARLERYAAQTAGYGYVFLSVGHDGRVQSDNNVLTIGDPHMSLTPEWLHEFPTVLYRYWYALKIHERDRGVRPDRNILLGHSKGGLLNYLFACVRQAYRDGRLNEFAANLVNERGERILPADVFTEEVLVEIGRELDNDVIGTVGSPLWGVPDKVLAHAKKKLGPLGFNEIFDRSGEFFSPAYVKKIHDMTGYSPEEVLDFVVTSRIDRSVGRMDRFLRGAELLVKAGLSPIVEGPNAFFHYVGALLDPSRQHDGIGPYEYPANFGRKHIQIDGFTHIDQSGDEKFLDLVIAELLQRTIL